MPLAQIDDLHMSTIVVGVSHRRHDDRVNDPEIANAAATRQRGYVLHQEKRRDQSRAHPCIAIRQKQGHRSCLMMRITGSEP